ncbi:MAG: division/cell wall cluster transcriptional repressor MraZ [Spiroplasma sp.]
MILGQATTTLDAKKRISIPSKFHWYFQVSENIIISRGFESCLVIYTVDEFVKWQEKILQQSEGLKESRILARQIFANSEKVVIDAKSRVTIPTSLIEISQIKSKVIVIGMSNKLEVWSEEKWKSFNEETKDKLEEVAMTLKEF